MKFILAAIKLFIAIIVVAIPVLAVWLSSSLAVYLNAPLWAAILVGALLFPLFPLFWETWSAKKFVVKQEKREASGKKLKKKWMSWGGRFILRTLLLNLTFLGTLLAIFPKQSFEAVNTRGDWMLQNRQGAYYDTTRNILFATANSLEGLHNLTRENPYKKYEPDDQPKVKPKPNQIPIPKASDIAKAEKEKEVPEVRRVGEAPSWPMSRELHPLVRTITKSDEATIKSVANYLAKEKDPFLRVKALNDYVADRIAYDAPALAEGRYPPQDAETVFRTGKAVCAGYSKLMVALAKHTGDKMIYVTGVSREQNGEIAGGGHAWNAVEIEGAWYLIDTTWNAGHVNGSKFTKSYRTDYLFTPPKAFGVGHFPDKEKWQLKVAAISRGEFVRQPMMSASFFANGFELISPTRSQVTIDSDRFVAHLKNPLGRKLLVKIHPKLSQGSSGEALNCDVNDASAAGKGVRLSCPVEDSGIYKVQIFAAKKGPVYTMMGQIEVVR